MRQPDKQDADYELVVAVTDAEIAQLIERCTIVRTEDLTTDAESFAFLVAVRTAIAQSDLRRSISFHSFVARARVFARWPPRVRDKAPIPETSHVAGTMPTGERNRVVERLRHPDVPTIVTNAHCLTEGIDIPALDAVVFIDPRGSHIDVVQAVGRAMRRAEGKERGRVILPVFLIEAQAADPEAAVESTRVRVELGARATRLVDSGSSGTTSGSSTRRPGWT